MLAAVRAVLQMDPSHRILVCTPSHTAANVVTRRLADSLEPSELVRLVDPNRPVETIPIEVLKYCHQSEEFGKFIIPPPALLLNFRVIVCTCSDAYLLYSVGMTNQQLRIQRQCFRHHWTSVCSQFHMTADITDTNRTHFTHLFIDEAAQASEPETLVPFSVVLDTEPGTRKVEIALVGDPRQLASTSYVASTPSLMERLLLRPVRCLGGGKDHLLGDDAEQFKNDWLRYAFRQNDTELLSVFLTFNYRGHPSFLMIPSSLFYSDKLQSMAEPNNRFSFWCKQLRLVETLSTLATEGRENGYNNIPNESHHPLVRYKRQFSWPIHFRGVQGTDTTVTTESGFGTNSWANPEEAAAVAEIVEVLALKIPTQSIGVMSPFRGQVVAIRNLLRTKGLGAVNVGTVEDYQSVEHDVIVLSLTRSTIDFVEHDVKHCMGLLGQPKRANVAMTRAEFLFIVVGNPLVMLQDFVWRQFLLFCHRNGLHYGVSAPEISSALWSFDTVDGDDDYGSKCILSSWDQETTNKNFVIVSTIEQMMRNVSQ